MPRSKKQVKMASKKVQNDLIGWSLHKYLLTYTLFGKIEMIPQKRSFIMPLHYQFSNRNEENDHIL